jgi:hypothetical protein|tara:strand:- start:1579 stop:2016 length:438 start_codon:yes stop_codon:yes gene_type:complete
MTPGYLFDLFIINETRKEKLADTLDCDVKYDLDRQNGFYLREIGTYLSEISAGTRPGIFRKNKNYDGDVQETKNSNLIEILYKLSCRHSELWDLEDIRRDKNNTDAARLAAADRVSIVNKKRNDLVEQIDEVISGQLAKLTLYYR